eukprot:SAG25_NODE_488_length_7463_cov_6.443781_3_plen_172_part_00
MDGSHPACSARARGGELEPAGRLLLLLLLLGCQPRTHVGDVGREAGLLGREDKALALATERLRQWQRIEAQPCHDVSVCQRTSTLDTHRTFNLCNTPVNLGQLSASPPGWLAGWLAGRLVCAAGVRTAQHLRPGGGAGPEPGERRREHGGVCPPLALSGAHREKPCQLGVS